MNYFSNYKYALTQVTAIAIDTTVANNPYLWIAFSQNSNGFCLLKKVSASNLNQVYYTISVPCENINALLVANGYVYVVVNPLSSGIYQNVLMFTYSITNPLSVWYANTRPTGISALADVEENGIAIVYDGSTYVYILIPGIVSGLVAMIVQFNKATLTPSSAVFNDLIPLQQGDINVRYASSITIDGIGNLWVSTNTNPATIIETTPGVWTLTETSLS